VNADTLSTGVDGDCAAEFDNCGKQFRAAKLQRCCQFLHRLRPLQCFLHSPAHRQEQAISSFGSSGLNSILTSDSTLQARSQERRAMGRTEVAPCHRRLPHRRWQLPPTTRPGPQRRCCGFQAYGGKSPSQGPAIAPHDSRATQLRQWKGCWSPAGPSRLKTHWAAPADLRCQRTRALHVELVPDAQQTFPIGRAPTPQSGSRVSLRQTGKQPQHTTLESTVALGAAQTFFPGIPSHQPAIKSQEGQPTARNRKRDSMRRMMFARPRSVTAGGSLSRTMDFTTGLSGEGPERHQRLVIESAATHVQLFSLDLVQDVVCCEDTEAHREVFRARTPVHHPRRVPALPITPYPHR
jgi:hypothetical protein